MESVMILMLMQVFAPIHHTLQQVFLQVIPYAQHVPSFADTWVRFHNTSSPDCSTKSGLGIISQLPLLLHTAADLNQAIYV